MMEIKAPNDWYPLVNRPIIFLAGSIEMGQAAPWQSNLVKACEDLDVLFLNPRRDDWDLAINDYELDRQVNWELGGIENSDLVVFCFDPATKSPVTMLELGLVAGRDGQAVVYCPEPFWRRTNVHITAERYRVDVVHSFEELVQYVKDMYK